MADPAPVQEIFTASDGYRWRWRRYAPPGPARGRIVCLHGIQSHGGWYEHSCSQLAHAGFEAAFLDRRGSGVNEAARGDAPNFRRLLNDVAEFIQDRSQASGLRTIVMGISWGGKLATALAARHPNLVDGLALLCPGFCPRVGPTRKQRFAILFRRLFSPTRRFPVPLSDPQLFTASPRWQQFIRDDPLALREATARFFIESVRLDGYLRWKASRVMAPVLMLLAEHDRIIDNGRTRAFLDRLASADREIIEYPGAHHTLEFEPDPERYLGDLLRWLDKMVSDTTPR
jgi:alpha-beta hydrolase superfamily lysophospholipase